MPVSRDAASGWYVPATAAEWTTLLAGTGIANPSNLWLCQEASGSLADSIGAMTLTAFNSPAYNQAVAGWTRTAVRVFSSNDDFFGTGVDLSTTSAILFGYCAVNATPGAAAQLFSLGHFGDSQRRVKINTTPSVSAQGDGGQATQDGAANLGTTGHPVFLRVDRSRSAFKVTTDQETATPVWTSPTGAGSSIDIGTNSLGTLNASYLYLSLWTGTNAELSDAQLTTLINRLQNGPAGAVSITAITVTPSGPTIAPGAVQQFSAIATNSDASQTDVTSTAAWTSGTPGVGTIGSTGLATAVAVGKSVITATQSAISGTATLNVANAVTTPTFSMVAYTPPAVSGRIVGGVSIGTGITTTTGTPTASGAGTAPIPTPGLQWITDVTAVQNTTLLALQAGSVAYKYVVSIEGYPYLLTDADVSKAVLAYSGTDYTKALPGLFVELDNQQSIDPHIPFNNVGGTCTLRIQPDPTDQFGIDTHRKASGAEALLMAAANRLGTGPGSPRKTGTVSTGGPFLQVDNGSTFATGDAFCGTECVSIGSADPTQIWTTVRGKYSPFSAGGSGSPRFAQHHRVMADANGVALNPVVSQQPRTWIGKRVRVAMHKVDGTGLLNGRNDALVVFAGRIVTISDDPSTGFTVVELEHELKGLTTATIGRDMYSAQITGGVNIITGRAFTMTDTTVSASKTANNLTVVASGASGTNQINAGYYSLEEICSFLNSWLSAELAAGRIQGSYTWASPVTSNVGLRTKCYWRIPATANTNANWSITMPGEVGVYLGLVLGADPGSAGSTIARGAGGTASAGGLAQGLFQGSEVPWRVVMYTLTTGQGGMTLTLNIDQQRGTAFDQYALLPPKDKPASANGLNWGIFLLDEKSLIVASFDSNLTQFSNCVPCSYALPGIAPAVAVLQQGRRADDTATGPTTIRQVYIMVTSLSTLIKTLFYTTGTQGYNQPVYDSLGYGLGVGIPYEMLSTPFEQSVDNMPHAQDPVACVIAEPTTLADLIGADLNLRRAFPIWKGSAGLYGNGGIIFSQWQTPNSDLTTLTLTEANKAEPSGNIAMQRSASIQTDEWVKNVIKIDYNRDITLSKDGTYQNTITFEDHTSVDDLGGVSNVMTIKANNTLIQFANTGASIESIAPGYLALVTLFSRPARKITRSIDIRAYEGNSPGDCVLFSDAFARDPATGTRGISGRPAILTRIRYNPGGPQAGNPSQITPPVGEVDLFFLDLHRYGSYAPAAQVDETQSNAGYNTLTNQITVYAHQHSETSELADAARFAQGDRVIISEIDPSTPANALTWSRLLTVSPVGNVLTIDQALLGWDTTKRYRVTFDSYQQCQPSQQGKVFMAGVATGRIAGVAQPYQWAATSEPTTTSANGSADLAELIPTIAYGDGRPWDTGNDRAMVRTLNALIDYKTAHQSPALFRTSTGLPMIIASGLAGFIVGSISPIFLGFDLLSISVDRSLTIAPFLRSNNGNAGQLRITLSRTMPMVAPGGNLYGPIASLTVAFADVFDQATWTVGGSTTWSTGAPQTLTIKVKDTMSGLAWLTIENQGAAETYGFARCVEGPRHNSEQR